MPRLRKDEGPYSNLLKLFRGYRLGGEELARVIGKSPTTGYERLRNPGKITIEELRKINRAGIPIDEIRAAL